MKYDNRELSGAVYVAHKHGSVGAKSRKALSSPII
jgi:hypothetical protein